MSRTADTWAALNAAMEHLTPECINDPRFTDDTTRAADVAEICDDCPLLAACKAFATASRPAAGIWGGRRWTGKRQGERAEST